MKFYVSVLAVFLPISLTNADSWTYRKGQYYTFHGVYSTLPTSSNCNQLLSFRYSFLATSLIPPFNQYFAGANQPLQLQTKISSAKVSYTFEVQYGLTNDLTIFTKVDVGQVNEKFNLSLTDPLDYTRDTLGLHNNYFSLESNFGFRQRIVHNNTSVLSTSWAFFPGEFRFYNRSANSFTPLGAIEGGLSYRKNFKLTKLATYFE